MSGPLADPTSGTTTKAAKDYSNQILDYLMGFSPKIDVEEEVTDASASEHTPAIEAKKPKVNSRDAKLHFLMGRYNS